jgi:hypothetical protein
MIWAKRTDDTPRHATNGGDHLGEGSRRRVERVEPTNSRGSRPTRSKCTAQPYCVVTVWDPTSAPAQIHLLSGPGPPQIEPPSCKVKVHPSCTSTRPHRDSITTAAASCPQAVDSFTRIYGAISATACGQSAYSMEAMLLSRPARSRSFLLRSPYQPTTLFARVG